MAVTILYICAMQLKEYIKGTGLKNEYIINAMGIHRNIYYAGLKDPSVFNKDHLSKLAKVLRCKKSELIEIIRGPQNSGPDNR